jgi:hypothetical protein
MARQRLLRKVHDRAQSAIGADEEVRAAFPAQAGGPRPEVVLIPLLALFVAGYGAGAIPMAVLFALLWRYRVIAVTDQDIIVFKASFWRPATPAEVLERIPRTEASLTPMTRWLWWKLLLDEDRYWVAWPYRAQAQACAGTNRDASPPPELGAGGRVRRLKHRRAA